MLNAIKGASYNEGEMANARERDKGQIERERQEEKRQKEKSAAELRKVEEELAREQEDKRRKDLEFAQNKQKEWEKESKANYDFNEEQTREAQINAFQKTRYQAALSSIGIEVPDNRDRAEVVMREAASRGLQTYAEDLNNQWGFNYNMSGIPSENYCYLGPKMGRGGWRPLPRDPTAAWRLRDGNYGNYY